MNESILTSIKKLLGITEDITAFDQDIIIHINSVFMVLEQMGVGNDFVIVDKTATWNQYISDITKFNSVKTYVYLRVKMLFDPPQSGSVMNAYNQQIAEFEWRLHFKAESKPS